ncbi:hypothetical protein HGRIS_003602 [Hohenbuehelia grisea]|uniref:ThuA-like domain-containing protein n=1 Tax=Hohenbuehelia grisea TaxID=104357 RepID=A0ABR3JFY5_9AGAR
MMYSIKPATCVLATVFLVASCAMAQSNQAHVLIYSATRGFRHDSIPTATQALKNAGSSINVKFDSTEDHSQFTDANLAQYDALLFLMNTGEVLDDSGKAALQTYLNRGGNFIAVHSASDSLNTTAFYGREVGAYFDNHADLQPATINVIDANHPSTSKLPARWQTRDEWYNFKSDPRSVGAVVVLSVDESTYTDTTTKRFDQGSPHPTAWYQEHGAGVEVGGTAGRSFYTSLGHTNETWEDEIFMSHVLGGVSWVLASNTTKATNASAQVGNAASSSGASGASGASPSSNTAASTSGASNAASSFAPFFGIMSSTPISSFGAVILATTAGAIGGLFLLSSW